jgi:hypothetical protein
MFFETASYLIDSWGILVHNFLKIDNKIDIEKLIL